MPKKTKDIVETKAKKSSNNKDTKKAEKSSAISRAKKTTSKNSTNNTTITSVKKNSTKVKSTTSKNDFVSVLEYYDLPYRYNKTIVKILAQTPKILFVYWDISDSDRQNFISNFGKDFFSKTKPVLIIHNETMGYSFEIEINDFANSWYLHVNDADCKYTIELGRKPYEYNSNINEDYIYITSSNNINLPNDHILFEKFNPNVTYRNVKNGNTFTKDFSKDYKNMKKIYSIYDLYKEIYKNELFEEITGDILTNPSSMSSSGFRS